MSQLTLYHFIGCPYCQKVRDFIDQNKMNVPLKDIRQDAKFKEELIKIGGKSQVPCLIIDGKPLYESLDIIDWLKKNYDNTRH